MAETEKHKQLKLLGRTILKTRGFENSDILEEYKVKIGNKNFIVDVCAFKNSPTSGIKSIAVECGNTNPEKLVNLKLLFDEIIHLPYGITSLQSDLRELIDEQQTQIKLLNKSNKSLKNEVSKHKKTIERHQNGDKIYHQKDRIIEALHNICNEHYYSPSKEHTEVLEKIASIIRESFPEMGRRL